jgi:NAD(P)-dependent dehydrogenase (short-subunit alcohol dehydrogenase family)
MAGILTGCMRFCSTFFFIQLFFTMINYDFTGKTVLISGGSSGIGLATAQLFLKSGAQVIITGRNTDKLNEAVHKYAIDGRLTALPVDSTKTAELKILRDHIRDKFGKLDIVFANAGIGLFKPFLETTEEDFDLLINTNLKGTFFLLQYMIPLMKQGSSIVINASWTQHLGLKSAAAYSASKSAIAGLTKDLAAELAGSGIRVNAVSPGYTMTEQFNETTIGEEEAIARKNLVPLKRFGNAPEIANVVAFLSSENASYINGQELLADGGLVTVDLVKSFSK